jgi:hypothetical protein
MTEVDLHVDNQVHLAIEAANDAKQRALRPLYLVALDGDEFNMHAARLLLGFVILSILLVVSFVILQATSGIWFTVFLLFIIIGHICGLYYFITVIRRIWTSAKRQQLDDMDEYKQLVRDYSVGDANASF